MISKSDLIWISDRKKHQEKAALIKKLLKQSGRFVVFSAQLMGYCPFSIDNSNKMSSKGTSLPFLMSVFHIVAMILWSAYLMVNKNKLDGLASNRGTGRVSYQGVVFAIYSQHYIRVLTIRHRNGIVKFWDKLQSSLVQTYVGGSAVSKTIFEEQLVRKRSKMNIAVLVNLVLATLHIGCFIFVSMNKLYILFGIYEIIPLVLGLILWNANGILLILKILWHAHIIDTITIGFSVLSTSKALENRSIFLYQYKCLEDVVTLFNSTYSVDLTVSMISLGFHFINALYTACTVFDEEHAWQFWSNVAAIFVHGTALLLICSSATQLTKQVNY